ncbi:hypothetical protein RIF29_29259 [Crotalaria pallida]|uniref:Uncharacterized protein n=1 Tax=Crotalaria pallida TaxID=3830 RepID=A0AAN9I077_CROPI
MLKYSHSLYTLQLVNFEALTVCVCYWLFRSVLWVVTWKECLGGHRNQTWDTLTWFAALIAMAGYLNKYGLISWFSQTVVKISGKNIYDILLFEEKIKSNLVIANGFKAAYAIKGCAEGPRGWPSSCLLWKTPKKGPSVDFGSLTEDLGDTSDGLAVALGIAAATGLGLLAFTEIETILGVLGSAAIVQFASKKLLFAELKTKWMDWNLWPWSKFICLPWKSMKIILEQHFYISS